MSLASTLSNLPRGARRGLVVAVVLIVGLGAGWLWMQRAGRGHGPLVLYGNVDIREVQLGFQESGRISRMAFEEGDRVAAGARMAALDPERFEEALAVASAAERVAHAELDKVRHARPQAITQAQATLHKAQAIAADAERNDLRQRDLLASGSSSQRIVDAARAASAQAAAGVRAATAALTQTIEETREGVAAATARWSEAQARRAEAATALADTVLYAPSPGTVISRVREPGSMVTSQSTVYTLSLDRPVYVRAYVGERALGRIAPGMRVRVRTDSSDKIYYGQIGFISPRAEFTPKTVETPDLRTELVYRLRIVVENADAALRQGMPVTVSADGLPAGSTPAKGA